MFMCIIISLSCFVNYKLRFFLQFTRTLLRSDSVLARKSERRRVRRERHFMSKNELRSSGERRRRGFANGAGEQ